MLFRSGCRMCETVCSLGHEGKVIPSKARISVIKDEQNGIDFPVFCQQCEQPLCIEVCPTLALTKDTETGIVSINENKCIGCAMCVMACPIGGIVVTDEKKMKKCNLCEGKPRCAANCPTKALEYLQLTKITKQKQRKGLGRMIRLIGN